MQLDAAETQALKRDRFHNMKRVAPSLDICPNQVNPFSILAYVALRVLASPLTTLCYVLLLRSATFRAALANPLIMLRSAVWPSTLRYVPGCFGDSPFNSGLRFAAPFGGRYYCTQTGDGTVGAEGGLPCGAWVMPPVCARRKPGRLLACAPQRLLAYNLSGTDPCFWEAWVQTRRARAETETGAGLSTDQHLLAAVQTQSGQNPVAGLSSEPQPALLFIHCTCRKKVSLT